MRLIKNILLLYLIFTMNFGNGVYNGLTGISYCRTPEACRHEIGHRIDFENGNPSNSMSFSYAISTYLVSEIKKEVPSYLAMQILIHLTYYKQSSIFITENTSEELYADMYLWVDGDISKLPDVFQPFYSKDKGYNGLYNCLTTGERVKVCGKSIFYGG